MALNDTALTYALQALGVQLPAVLVLGIGVGVLLFNLPPGRLRTMAVTALVILLLGNGLPGALNMFVLHSLMGSMSNLEMLPIVMSTISIGFSLLRAVGYGMLVLVLVRALSRPAAKTQKPAA